MLSSLPMTEMPSGKTIQVHVDDNTLAAIKEQVQKNPDAMAALEDGYIQVQKALERGDISSPEPPDSYTIIFEIMNQFDSRYAGTLGPRIIKFLQEQLLSGASQNG